MRSTLYLKFILIYIVFGFLSIFSVATLTSSLFDSTLLNDASASMYRSANLLASNYLPDYFDSRLTVRDLNAQIGSLQVSSNGAVWFVDKEGNMIASSTPAGYPSAPYNIADFNPAETGNKKYLTGNYHYYFTQDVITVIAPVISGYEPGGYLLIHKKLSTVNALQDKLMQTVYITVVVICVFSFLILLAFQFFVYLPLRKITEAARQYAKGNLDYEIVVSAQDEMGHIAESLNYMASQLKNMEDTQRKFIANVSHDFRSPLTSIKGYVEAISDGTIPHEMQEKYLKIIAFEADRLTDLTRDLLTLNEFNSPDLRIDKIRFELHDMIKQVAASFEGTCLEKQIHIELIFATKFLYVFADKQKIQQVLYNLLDNAIKFSDSQGVVTIETKEKGEKVSVSIKDEGMGIPKESLQKIWERFYKTDLSRGKDKKGTGLGLAIVKEAIHAHGETVNVTSTEGLGTEFVFTLSKPS
ncbi:MAG: HAMP domain-containing protein [Lachnospiraceae bacterium]|jgi:signal transduction histidine kinase|nr:HAMP domain-containing protein [Lachnospiraceae bacterium]